MGPVEPEPEDRSFQGTYGTPYRDVADLTKTIMTGEAGVPSRLEKLCIEKGLKMTDQRRIIARVLSEAQDHPDVELLHRRAAQIDPGISLATVYRTVRLFEEASILERHDFGDGRARYEEAKDDHHDHLIDIQSGRVIEFTNEQIEKLQKGVAAELGYKLVGHRLELYAVPLNKDGEADESAVGRTKRVLPSGGGK
jgi:Fur family ferric uptake transcriptional regulator